MAEILNLEEVAAFGFLDDLPEEATFQRKQIRQARLNVRNIRKNFDSAASDIREATTLSDIGIADALRKLAETHLAEIEKQRAFAAQMQGSIEKLVAGEPPSDSTNRELRALRRRMLLDRFLELDQETRLEILLDINSLDLETLQAIAEAPAWLKRRVGSPEYLDKIDEAIIKLRDPERGAEYLAAKAELAQLRNEIEIVAKPFKEAAGMDALAAAASG